MKRRRNWTARGRCSRPSTVPHEGYAVILEELDELWDEVRASKPGADCATMRTEALQVAAMALRFVHDVCDGVVLRPGP
jgi:hypothetical protein